MILCRRIDSPVGPLMLAAGDDGLRHIEFRENRHPADRSDWHGGDSPVLQAAEAQLREYFAGERRAFDLPLAPRGTPFQLQVWQALARARQSAEFQLHFSLSMSAGQRRDLRP